MNSHTTVEEKVMKKIKQGSVQLRSRYIFLAEKLGMGSVFVVTVLLAVLFCALVLLYIKSSDNLGYLAFGNRGVLAFLESFPSLLMATFIVLMLFAGFLIKKSDVSYKKSFGYYALGLIGIVVISGILVSATTLDERIEDEAYNPHFVGMMFRPFLGRGVDDRSRGVVGRVIEVGEGYIRVQTPRTIRKIDLSDLEPLMQQPFVEGLFVMAVGEPRNDAFEAHGIRMIGAMDMPMIRRGVHRHFGPFMGIVLTPEDEECLQRCVRKEEFPQTCRQLCLSR